MTSGERDSREKDAFEVFLEEVEDMLFRLGSCVQTLLSEPENPNVIHGLFRVVHSLKGNSALFDYESTRAFCHAFEDFLSHIREKNAVPDARFRDGVVEGCDRLDSLFRRVLEKGASEPMIPSEIDFLKRLDELLNRDSDASLSRNLKIGIAELAHWVQKHGEVGLTRVLKQMLQVAREHAPDWLEESISANSGDEPASLENTVEDGLTRGLSQLRILAIRASQGEAQEDDGEVFAAAVALIRQHSVHDAELQARLDQLDEEFQLFFQDELGLDEVLVQAMEDFLEHARVPLSQATDIQAPPVSAERNAGSRSHMVMVSDRLLDDFLGHAGELVNLGELFKSLHQRLERGDVSGLSGEFKNTNQAFMRLSDELQQTLYALRRSPLTSALERLAPLARQIARDQDKMVDLEIRGGDLEVDRRLVEKVETILGHVVRNAVDHGIETRSRRLDAGKPETGRVEVHITQDRSHLHVKVADDGRGVDLESVTRAAEERGIIPPGRGCVSQGKALELIVTPGFSTASRVSQTSGRGVGMDVLASSLRELGGHFELDSRAGLGMTVRFTLPLTFAARIRMGLNVLVGKHRVLIPLEYVRQTFSVPSSELYSVQGRGQCVKRDNRVLPVVNIHEVLETVPVTKSCEQRVCLLLQDHHRLACAPVDAIGGQRQIVSKELRLHTRQRDLFEGVSMLDGSRLALVLNVAALLNHALTGGADAQPEMPLDQEMER